MLAIFPEMNSLAEAQDIEKLAIKAREYFVEEGAFRPKLNFEGILQAVGVEVRTMTCADDAIILAKDEGGRPRIVVILSQDVQNIHELSFLHAFVLGKLLLHVLPKIAKGEWSTSGLKVSQSPYRRYLQAPTKKTLDDSVADFAAAMLIPRAMMEKARIKMADQEALAQFFGVETTFVRARLQSMGVLKDELYSSLEKSSQPKLKTTAYRNDQKKVEPTPSSKSGMDKIRELARKLDKSPR